MHSSSRYDSGISMENDGHEHRDIGPKAVLYEQHYRNNSDADKIAHSLDPCGYSCQPDTMDQFKTSASQVHAVHGKEQENFATPRQGFQV